MIVKFQDRRHKKKKSVIQTIFILLLLTVSGITAYKDNFFQLFDETVAAEEDTIYYYYNSLSSDMKKEYTRILNGILEEEEKIPLKRFDNTDEVNILMTMIQADHPEIFWYDFSWNCYTLEDLPVYVSPSYNCYGEERNEKQEDIDKAVSEALMVIGEKDSDYEKIKAVFEYLIATVDYELDAPDNQNIYSSLVNKKTVCSGYARATQYLAQKMGLQCIYATGDIIEGGGHAWTIVRCDDRYYQVDTTFGDPTYTIEEDSRPEELKTGYGYLCITDAEMYADRIVDPGQDLPVCDCEDLNYYRVNDIFFDGNTEEVWDSVQEAVASGKHIWEGQFAQQEDYENVLMEIENGEYSQMVLDYSPDDLYSVRTYYSYDDNRKIVWLWY